MRFGSLVVCLWLVTPSFSSDWLVCRVHCPSAAAIRKLADADVALLSERVSGETEVAVPRVKALDSLGLRYEVIGKLADPTLPYLQPVDGADYKTEYFTNDEIIQQYETWRQQYPTLIQREQIATTAQGRPVWVYRLHNANASLPVRGVFFHALIHAREWISGPVCMYIFESLLNDALTSGAGWQRITQFEFSVVPVLNPDGYVYTWEHYRLWRKNRRNNGGGEYGVDLNRNYPIGWGGVGSSGNPGSDVYRGPSPFSEPELAGVRDYLMSREGSVALSYTLDYHSYGQYVIHPLGYTTNPAPDYSALNSIAQVYGAAVEATGGLNYTIGQSAVVQYPAGGTSEDYYYDEYRSMGGTIELRPEGSPGFQLPPSQIWPTVREHWAGFRAAIAALQ